MKIKTWMETADEVSTNIGKSLNKMTLEEILSKTVKVDKGNKKYGARRSKEQKDCEVDRIISSSLQKSN